MSGESKERGTWQAKGHRLAKIMAPGVGDGQGRKYDPQFKGFQYLHCYLESSNLYMGKQWF